MQFNRPQPTITAARPAFIPKATRWTFADRLTSLTIERTMQRR